MGTEASTPINHNRASRTVNQNKPFDYSERESAQMNDDLIHFEEF